MMAAPALAPAATDRAAAPMRVEMVVPSLVTAGMEMVVATLVRALARRGHDVGVTCNQEIGAVGEQLRAEGVSVQLVPAPGILTNIWPRDLARWFAERRPDIVHVHSGVWLKAARPAEPPRRAPRRHRRSGSREARRRSPAPGAGTGRTPGYAPGGVGSTGAARAGTSPRRR